MNAGPVAAAMSIAMSSLRGQALAGAPGGFGSGSRCCSTAGDRVGAGVAQHRARRVPRSPLAASVRRRAGR